MGQIVKRDKSQLGSLRKLIKELTIREIEDVEPIKEALRYVFVIIGLKKLPNKDKPKEDVPSDEEVLLDFIIRNYGGYHPIEIRAAFELAINGKLTIKPELLNHYQDFNCVYFGRIMTAYRPYREKLLSKQFKEKEDEKELSEDEKKELMEDSVRFYEDTVLAKYDALINDDKDYKFTLTEEQLGYYDFNRLGIEMSNKEAKRAMYEEEKQNFKHLKFPLQIESKTRIVCMCKTFRLFIQQKAFEDYDLRTELKNKLCEYYFSSTS